MKHGNLETRGLPVDLDCEIFVLGGGEAMSEWTREHDRIIAERCEGILIKLGQGVDGSVRYDHYNTDIAACFRAAEAWRMAKIEDRKFVLRSPWKIIHKWEACCYEHESGDCSRKFADSEAKALAEALYEAVKDTELEK